VNKTPTPVAEVSKVAVAKPNVSKSTVKRRTTPVSGALKLGVGAPKVAGVPTKVAGARQNRAKSILKRRTSSANDWY